MNECIKISVESEDMADFFFQYRKELEKCQMLVAENTETGYKAYLTNDKGKAVFTIWDTDGDCVEDDSADSVVDLCDLAELGYLAYIYPTNSADPDYDEREHDEPHEDIDDTITEREDELKLATDDFLLTVYGDQYYDFAKSTDEEDLEEILDHFLIYLQEQYSIPIFRPTMIEDGNGDEYCVRYPYCDEDPTDD